MESRSRLVSNLRGLAFGVAVLALGFGVFGAEARHLLYAAAAFFIAFVVLVFVHAKVIDAEQSARRWLEVNRRAQLRLGSDFRSLADDGKDLVVEQHPYADDLDVLGHGSLFQRISVAHTRFGRRALADWLLSAAPLSVVHERQEAVKALAPELEVRQRVETEGLLLVGAEVKKAGYQPPVDPEPLLSWAASPARLLESPGLVWACRLLPPTSLVLFVGARAAALPEALWVLSLVLQAVLVLLTQKQVGEAFLAVSSTEGAFLRYGAMLAALESVKQEEGSLKRLRESLHQGGVVPSVAMRRFKTLLGWFELKHNGMVHPFVNLALLWDVHCTVGLEHWKARVGARLRDWFTAIGEFEALSSLAGLSHDEPGFCFPEVSEQGRGFVAEGLAHPLLSRTTRVANTVELPQPGTALLVTGSNMSGKSTLLRSMGLATVLALAGGPVCARRLELSGLSLITSMRVRDSLEAGVSHFYAEIQKLSSVVKLARSGKRVFFLLDEILHGTNSTERQIGARWVMSELLRLGATGAVSTHDVELCQLPAEQMGKVKLVHLREDVKDGAMTFDFKLREGPVVEGNALRLMRLVGLEVPLPSSDLTHEHAHAIL